MSHHTPFDRAVNAAAARRERERGQACDECGGKYWRAGGRIWHDRKCSQFKRGEIKPLDRAGRSPAMQDRMARELRDSDCECGTTHLYPCPHAEEAKRG